MKRYDDLVMEIVRFVATDIVTLSNDSDNLGNDLDDWS